MMDTRNELQYENYCPRFILREDRTLTENKIVDDEISGDKILYVPNIYAFIFSDFGSHAMTFEEKVEWCIKYAQTAKWREVEKSIDQHIEYYEVIRDMRYFHTPIVVSDHLKSNIEFIKFQEYITKMVISIYGISESQLNDNKNV